MSIRWSIAAEPGIGLQILLSAEKGTQCHAIPLHHTGGHYTFIDMYLMQRPSRRPVQHTESADQWYASIRRNPGNHLLLRPASRAS